MKKIILFILFVSINASALAQILTVKDRDNGRALEKVSLSSTKPAWSAFTNAAGQLDISKAKNAEAIEIKMLGYKTIKKSYKELEQDNFQIYLEPTTIFLDQIVVTSTRWNQPKIEVPAKITTISPQEVAFQNPQTAADLLSISTDVSVQKSQQGGGSPRIRGFSTNRLLYVVDGVRMNTTIFRTGNLQNVISLDPFAIENSEIMLGPGSVIYGSDAIGGVMNFQTLTPEFSVTDKPYFKGSAVTRYSTANGEQTAHFDINAGWKNFASVTSITTYDFGDLRMGRFGPDKYLKPFYVERANNTDMAVINPNPLMQVPNAYSQVNLMQKLRYAPDDNWDIQYGFHYSTTSDYPRYDRLIRTKKLNVPKSAEWNYGPQVWIMNNLSINNNSENLFYSQMSIRLADQYFEESRLDRNFNDKIRRSRVEKVDAYSVNFDFLKNFGEVSGLYYGIEAVINEVKSVGTDIDITTDSSKVGSSRYPQSTWSSYAAYLTYKYNVMESLTLQAGARYNQFGIDADFTNNLPFFPMPVAKTSLNKGSLTGSLGFVFNPSEDWSLAGNFSTGFRSPNVDDLGKISDPDSGLVVVPNPDLDAEYAYNGEISIAKTFGDFLKFDLSAYYTYLDKAMVRRNFTLDGQSRIFYDGDTCQVQAIQNAASANVYGIEFGLEIKLPAGFGISSRINYQKGEEELDDGTTSSLRHAVPWFGVTRLTYSHDKLNMQLYGMYSGERTPEDMPEEELSKTHMYIIDKNGNPYSPSWFTLNFKAQYQLTDIFSVIAGVENIADKRYRVFGSGIVAPGRNVFVSLKANF